MTHGVNEGRPNDEAFALEAIEECFGHVVDATERNFLRAGEHLRLHETLIEAEHLEWALSADRRYKLETFIRHFLSFSSGLKDKIESIVVTYSFEERSGLAAAECTNNRYYGYEVKVASGEMNALTLEASSRDGVLVCNITTLSRHLAGSHLAQHYILRSGPKSGVDDALVPYDESRLADVTRDLTPTCYQWAIYGYRLKDDAQSLADSAIFRVALRTAFLFHITVWNSFLKNAHDSAKRIGRVLPSLRKRIDGLKEDADTFYEDVKSIAAGHRESKGLVLPVPASWYGPDGSFLVTQTPHLLHSPRLRTVRQLRALNDELARRHIEAADLWQYYNWCGGPKLVQTCSSLADDSELAEPTRRKASNLMQAILLLTRKLVDFQTTSDAFDADLSSICTDQILLALLYGLEYGAHACSVSLFCDRGSDTRGGCCLDGCSHHGAEPCFGVGPQLHSGRLETLVQNTDLLRYQNVKPQHADHIFDPRPDWSLKSTSAPASRFDEFLCALRDFSRAGGAFDLKEIEIRWSHPEIAGFFGRARLEVVFRCGIELSPHRKERGVDTRGLIKLAAMHRPSYHGDPKAFCQITSVNGAAAESSVKSEVRVTLWSRTNDEFASVMPSSPRQ